mgnify:CR=1 FL=1
MKEFRIDNVMVEVDENTNEDMAKEYLVFAQNNKKYKEAKIEKVIVKDGKMTIDFVQDKLKFARIRRITGYLTGTVGRWNDAKKAELCDRVKHG